ncbi:MAG: hypothetical protein FWF25_01400 [Propionibacteriaceae bacterium]|nr:hypothetical protein [Propionibacteriaceae bacterium]
MTTTKPAKPVEASSWVAALTRQATAPTTIPAADTDAGTKDTPPGAKPARTPRSTTKPVTAPKTLVAAPKTTTRATTPKPAPKPAQKAPTARQTPPTTPPAETPAPALNLKIRPPAKRAVGYNLPEDVIQLIDLAVATAAAKGQRLREGEAVTLAIRKTYGKLTRN